MLKEFGMWLCAFWIHKYLDIIDEQVHCCFEWDSWLVWPGQTTLMRLLLRLGIAFAFVFVFEPVFRSSTRLSFLVSRAVAGKQQQPALLLQTFPVSRASTTALSGP